MEDFNNWLDDMTFEFNNDFLGKDKSKLNDLLIENNIDKCEN
tara:strand:- start:131 stop:256 length:126 start_codon:yes stop_codon:yes gene_type:complete